jgi:hypothetical protein
MNDEESISLNDHNFLANSLGEAIFHVTKNFFDLKSLQNISNNDMMNVIVSAVSLLILNFSRCSNASGLLILEAIGKSMTDQLKTTVENEVLQ